MHSVDKNSPNTDQELQLSRQAGVLESTCVFGLEDEIELLKLIDSQDIEKLKAFFQRYGDDFKSLIKIKDSISPVFYAIYQDKLLVVKALIEIYGQENFLKQAYGEKKYNPIYYAILSDKSAILRLLFEVYGEEVFLGEKHGRYGCNPIFYSILKNKSDSIKVFFELFGGERLLQQVHKINEFELNVIFFSIFKARTKALQELLSLYGVESFLSIKFGQYQYNPIFFAIIEDQPKSLQSMLQMLDQKTIFEQEYYETLENPIFFAVSNFSSRSLDVLLNFFDKDALASLKNKFDEDLILVGLKKYFKEKNHNLKAQFAKENLQLLLTKILGDDIDLDRKILDLLTFYRNYCYLILGYSSKTFMLGRKQFISSLEYLEKNLQSVEGLIFKKANLLIKSHLNQILPIEISSDNPENLYIFFSKLINHYSYFVFHVNHENNRIIAISYLDGNKIQESQTLKHSPDLIFTVTKFILDHPIDFERLEKLKEIIEEFILNSSRDKFSLDFYDNFLKGNIEFCGQKLIALKQQNLLIASQQKRGNCVYKSHKILQRYLVGLTNPDYSFEIPTPANKNSIQKSFKIYKKSLKNIAVKNLNKMASNLDQSDVCDRYLLEKKQQILIKVRDKAVSKSIQSLKRKNSLKKSATLVTEAKPLLTRFQLSSILNR
jgi:hypothetical protein